MGGQGNILRTLLTTAFIGTLALGAPVKRDTSDKTVIQACEAAKATKKLCSSTTPTPWNRTGWNTYTERDAAEFLNKTLQDKNFTGTVREAVCNCFKDSESDSQRCEQAAGAIVLLKKMKNLIAAYGDSTQAHTIQIECSTSTDEVEVKQNLCDASECTLELLLGINRDEGPYYNYCN